MKFYFLSKNPPIFHKKKAIVSDSPRDLITMDT